MDLKNARVYIHSSLYKKCFWIFTFNFIFLGYLGSQAIVEPIIELSLFCTFLHFAYLFFILPVLINMDTYLLNLESKPKKKEKSRADIELEKDLKDLEDQERWMIFIFLFELVFIYKLL